MHRLIAITSITALALVACSGDGDISPETLEQALVAQGLDDDTAGCVAGELAEQLDQDDFNTVAKADDLNELDPALAAQATDAITNCLVGG